jgi:hypothetical protein
LLLLHLAAGPYRSYCMPAQGYEALLHTPPSWLVQQCGGQELAEEQWGLWLEVSCA